MSKQANQSDKWNYAVRQLQMRHPLTNALIPQFGNFREDTGECLGITSEQYGLIQNAELRDAAHAALATKGMSDFTERTVVTANGARFYTEFTFANKQLAMEVGDLFGFKLTLKNSFDRSMRAAFALGFMRLTCKNGASTLEKEFAVTAKHSSKVSVDFLGKAIDHALANGQHALRVFDTLAGVSISDEQGVNVLNQLVIADALSGSLRDDISTLWLNPRRQEDKARNLYNLYNAVTEHLTHQVSGSRFEYADKLSGGILMRLANAARHPERLAKLIVPVPAEQVQVIVDAAPVAAAAQATVIEAEIVG
jgi:hypothetical protein